MDAGIPALILTQSLLSSTLILAINLQKRRSVCLFESFQNETKR